VSNKGLVFSQACKAYADAVYFGVNDLSLRARAGIKLKDLSLFVKTCHDLKIKAYMTINSAIYNKDIKKAEELIKKAKKAKVDALIVWDFAVIDLAKKYKMPFIISTQMNVSNYKSAMFFKKLGAKRIVLAREMNLKDIAEALKKNKQIEIETLFHGAIVYCYFGRCILFRTYTENLLIVVLVLSHVENNGYCLMTREIKLLMRESIF
jgi:putative protease